MNFLGLLSAAEKWIASLVSGAQTVETVVATVKADPILSAGAAAAHAIVANALTKAGVSDEKVEAVGSEILSGLSGVSSLIPTVPALATDVTSGLELAGTAEKDVTATIAALKGVVTSHTTPAAQPTT